jgi:hypothetical protein
MDSLTALDFVHLLDIHIGFTRKFFDRPILGSSQAIDYVCRRLGFPIRIPSPVTSSLEVERPRLALAV